VGRQTSKAQKTGLEQQIEASREAAIGLPKHELFVELVQEKLSMMGFDTKRMALEMLDVKVQLDGRNVEAIGVMPIPDYVIATPQMRLWGHANTKVSRLSVRV